MKVIGFGHRSRMGKNTCAELFAKSAHAMQYACEITSFAKDLKECCYIAFKGYGLQRAEFYELPENAHFRDIKLPDINMTPVEIWVKVGTNLLREQMHDEVWVRSALYPREHIDFLILSDVRFETEITAIRKLGGIIVKVHNPRIPYKNTIADNRLESFTDWDHVIINDGTLWDLEIKVHTLYRNF